MDNLDFYNLKDRVLVIEHSINTTNKTLEDMKTVIVQQSEILKNFVEVKNLQQHLDAEVKSLKDDRKDSDNSILDISRFISKVNGGVIVGLFLFTIIQGTYAFILKEAYVNQKELQKEVILLKIQQEKISK